MDYLFKDFKKLLKKNYQEIRSLQADDSTNCMRVYDKNIGSIPVTVDIYNSYVLITDYRTFPDDEMPGPDPDELRSAASSMLYRNLESVIYARREKLSGHEQHGKQLVAPVRCTVMENGLQFIVELGASIDTGLFLDHAVTREMIRLEASRRSVLNLFSYTGAFSVYAAAGWSERVVSVDLSGRYLQWAKENMELNGLNGSLYQFIQEDCGNYLDAAAAEKERFDLVVFDPPTFSNSRKMNSTFNVQRDYASYLHRIARILKPSGAVVFSTNLSTFSMNKNILKEYQISEITRETIPLGFSRKRVPHKCWILKT
jgi:23S rRNA (guanine2445-N2)-methyltransferase / 23S rRNA (guanine2069-N7)-methyltransferase